MTQPVTKIDCPNCGRGTPGPDRICPFCIVWTQHGLCSCADGVTTWDLIRARQLARANEKRGAHRLVAAILEPVKESDL